MNTLTIKAKYIALMKLLRTNKVKRMFTYIDDILYSVLYIMVYTVNNQNYIYFFDGRT